MSEKSKAKCLVLQCQKTPFRSGHGLCYSCYRQALAMIKQEKTSWKELEKMGLCKRKSRASKKISFEHVVAGKRLGIAQQDLSPKNESP